MNLKIDNPKTNLNKKRRIGENDQFEQKREELARIVSAWERPPSLDGACNNLQILTPFVGAIQKDLSWSTAMCGVCQRRTSGLTPANHFSFLYFPFFSLSSPRFPCLALSKDQSGLSNFVYQI